ncbi:Protein of unknown function, partial [Gryllus bimaculatus]
MAFEYKITAGIQIGARYSLRKIMGQIEDLETDLRVLKRGSHRVPIDFCDSSGVTKLIVIITLFLNPALRKLLFAVGCSDLCVINLVGFQYKGVVHELRNTKEWRG